MGFFERHQEKLVRAKCLKRSDSQNVLDLDSECAFRFNFEKDLQKIFGKKTFFLFRKSEKFSCYENLKILEKVRKKMLYTRANTKCD